MRPKPPLLDLNLTGCSCMLSTGNCTRSCTPGHRPVCSLPVSSLFPLSLLCGLAPAASLSPLCPTPAGAPFSVTVLRLGRLLFVASSVYTPPAAVALQRLLHALTNSHLSPLTPTETDVGQAPGSLLHLQFT